MQSRRPRFDPWVRNIPWKREWSPTPVFLPEKPQEQRSPWGYRESDTAELLTYKHTHRSKMKTFLSFSPPIPSRIWTLSDYYYFYDSMVVNYIFVLLVTAQLKILVTETKIGTKIAFMES